MKILVLGSTGMLGQALIREGKIQGLDIRGAAINGGDYVFDIRDDLALTKTIEDFRPNVIINTVAILNINDCEKDPGLAYSINSRPATVLAEISKNRNIYFVHISTDHYYINEDKKSHNEDSPVTLINEYARTKYIAEAFALTSLNALVVRTNIVGFRGWENDMTLVEWIIDTLKNRVPIILFPDFYTSSIDVRQFSKLLFALINKKYTGLINVASRDIFSKSDFIKSLVSRLDFELNNFKEESVLTLPGSRRAESLGLDVSKVENVLGRRMPSKDMVIESLALEYEEKD